METIRWISRGTGALVAFAVMTFLALAVAFVMRAAGRGRFTGRVLVPFVFMELAIFFFILSIGFPRQDSVGPAVVPRLWMAGILGLGLYLFVRGLLGLEEEDPKVGRVDLVLLFAALSALYLVAMQFIGYFISTFLFAMTGMFLLSYRRVLVMLSVSVGWLLVSYFAFYKLLYVPLPQGRLIQLILG